MKKKYESPNFDFQEMKLMERVADVCWGTGGIWVDGNRNGSIDTDELFNLVGGGQGCGNKQTIADVLSKINEKYDNKFTPDDVKQNIKVTNDSVIKPIPNPS